MKKMITLFAVLTLSLSLAACGSSKEEEKETAEGNVIAQYINDGYEIRSFGISNDNDFHAILYSEEKDEYELIQTTLTDTEEEDYEAFDVFADDYEEQNRVWLTSLSGEMTATVMTDYIPTQEKLDELIGKTGAELEAMEYYKGGFENDEDGKLYIVYDYYNYDMEPNVDTCIGVYFDGLEDAEWDDLSDDVINEATVSKVFFRYLY